jgi:hypothetical protein
MDFGRNEELNKSTVERNILQTMKWKKANWIVNTWQGNCLLKQFICGKTQVQIE